MNMKLFCIVLLIIMIALSTIPIGQIDAKRDFGGSYDVSIYMVRYDSDTGLNPTYLFLDRSDSDPVYVTEENFDLLQDDVNKLPVLVSNIILPKIKELFGRHENTLENNYVEYIHIEYSLKHNIMDVLIITDPDYPGCNTESCAHQIIRVEPTAEGKMSLLNYLIMDIAVYGDLESRESYTQAFKMIETKALLQTKILAAQAKEILNKHRNELLSNVIGGKGSLADKVPIDGIAMRILGDVARVTVFHPEDELGLPVKAVDETITGVNAEAIPEFPVNLMTITAIGLIGVLTILRCNGMVLFRE